MVELADLFRVGDAVMVNTCEGFGGPGRVVELRDVPGCRCKVVLGDGSQPPFWAHDFELSPMPAGEGCDSRPDTIEHIGKVRQNLAAVVKDFGRRQREHDMSKLDEPEKSVFDEYTPKLKASTYGSDEYKGFLAAMKPALDHHYASNSHHPEHFADGVRGMSLMDVLEMLCDWKAATERHADGSLPRSIEINQKRFGYSDELRMILENTARSLGWL